MAAYLFDQVTNVCQKNSDFQDSKPIFMISDFKIFPKMLLRMNFGALSVWQLFYANSKEKKLFFDL